jgi:hypothetical protein
MASDARAKLITLHFTQGGRTAGIRLAYGTALALGIDVSSAGLGYVNRTIPAKSGLSRRLYPGGPSIPYNRAEGVRPVAVGPGSGRARTNKKLIVKADTGESATIYFSGRQADAVAWLNANAAISEGDEQGGYQLYSNTGRPLSRTQAS